MVKQEFDRGANESVNILLDISDFFHKETSFTDTTSRTGTVYHSGEHLGSPPLSSGVRVA